MSADKESETALTEPHDGSLPALPLAKIPDAEPPETYSDLARDYPVALVAGGLVAGLLAGALMPRGLGRKVGRGLVSGAVLAGELGLAYSQQAARKAGDAGRDGREKVIELGSQARAAGSRTATSSKELGLKLARQAIKLAAGLRR
ncbi:hypothetical protein [Novosphingobium sp. TH158]|uniref:hypothetical protein n=1 Tax=Novosphingobium sp. TH158 TaxID=2067455 RepID=UPI000C7DD8A2|nr:hypothetical protein [Novosphingobium sp. TH158]PLK25971.1 hypothetical protein C0V78_03000 [Novosphingobium sp. TH158]